MTPKRARSSEDSLPAACPLGDPAAEWIAVAIQAANAASSSALAQAVDRRITPLEQEVKVLKQKQEELEGSLRQFKESGNAGAAQEELNPQIEDLCA